MIPNISPVNPVPLFMELLGLRPVSVAGIVDTEVVSNLHSPLYSLPIPLLHFTLQVRFNTQVFNISTSFIYVFI